MALSNLRLLACSPGTCLIKQAVSMAVLLEKKQLRAKPLNINTAPPFWYFSNQFCGVLFATEVTLPGHRCSKSRESAKPSARSCTQFGPDLKSCVMVRGAPATLTESKKAAVALPPPRFIHQ